jgi:hypothetical protein
MQIKPAVTSHYASLSIRNYVPVPANFGNVKSLGSWFKHENNSIVNVFLMQIKKTRRLQSLPSLIEPSLISPDQFHLR